MKGDKAEPRRIKQKIREDRRKKKEKAERSVLAVSVAIILAMSFVLSFLIYSKQNQPSTRPISSSSDLGSEPKAAIVDHLSLTFPNQTFIEKATAILEQAGYAVDYYPGEKVTVELYRELPTYGHKLIILRVHSTATGPQGQESSVKLFTSERYSKTKHLYEQLTDQLGWLAFSGEEWEKGNLYFGISPLFVSQSMKDSFQNTAIIMMGCEGLKNNEMAEALIQKGAKVYISWSDSVSASHTDTATTRLLQHLTTEKQTIKQAVENTMKQVGSDSAYESQLIYYPLEAGDFTIQKILGNLLANSNIPVLNRLIEQEIPRRET